MILFRDNIATSMFLLQELEDALSILETRRVTRLTTRMVNDEITEPTNKRMRLSVAEAAGHQTDGTGTARLKELFRLLDAFGLTRSRVQKQLHNGMVGSVLQRIYHGESDAEMKMGMAEFKVKSSRQQFMAITPRRFGKTTAVSMFVSAFALAVPGTVTAIFSTGRRASNLLLQQIKQMLYCIPGVDQKIVSSNVETIVLQDGPLQSKISSYPGKART